MRGQILATVGATVVALGLLIGLPESVTTTEHRTVSESESVSDGATIVQPVLRDPYAVQLDPAQDCAYDVQIYLDDLAEGYSAAGEGMPVPSFSWDAAVQLCRGVSPDSIMFSDGSFVVVDTDREFPLWRGCLPGDVCSRSLAPLAWDVYEDGSYVARHSGLHGCVPAADCQD